MYNRNTCNGPSKQTKIQDILRLPQYKEIKDLWVHDCYKLNRAEIRNHTKMVRSSTFRDKELCTNMHFVSRTMLQSY